MSDMRDKFLEGLNLIINSGGYYPDKIARYACEFNLDYDFDDPYLNHVVNFLQGMDAGPEFELSETELRFFLKEKLKPQPESE
ncbi:hypothetical protein SGO26_17775 [Cupriavidus metallidurans]|uniref:hypothetical protein n=1 Tax=Cupriavidus TaxID=106589 RepID=UPI00257BDB2F|nr:MULTISPECIES: hypothetical protein [unclassified Cupriavidus]GMG92740.1 hypothetical protein Cmtc_39600 [Cupriavidus sp. TKC]